MDATHTFAYIFVQIGVGTPDNAPFLAVITMVRHLIRLSIHICLDRGGMIEIVSPWWCVQWFAI